MNTFQDLVDHGIHEKTAKMMLDNYSNRIGSMNGIYKITDITFNYENHTKEVELTCSQCGAVIYRSLSKSSNKWSELIKHCECEKPKKLQSDKKSGIARNDDEAYMHKVYGDYEIIEFVKEKHRDKSGYAVMWSAKCVHCGLIRKFIPSELKKGKKGTCRCQKQSTKIHIGKTYNRLTIIDVYGKKHKNSYGTYAKCICSCGKECDHQLHNVINGTVKSCGCYAKEIHESNNKSKSPLYSVWIGMKQRCFNPNNQSYANYGGRGITICDEWINNFESFEQWSIQNGYRPNNGLSIDRIDVNGNYCPENCRWASIYVQAVNRRPPKKRTGGYTINGVTKTKKEWCEQYGVWEATVTYRMNKMGMTLEEALTAEKIHEGNHFPKILDMQEDKKRELENLNKINSYIEANLYMAFIRSGSCYELEPQYKIDNYRADFFVKDTDIIVECDGYDTHKTKEQIANDYKRERYLMSRGYSIVRFSGSEINENPDRCVSELLEIINQRSDT